MKSQRIIHITCVLVACITCLISIDVQAETSTSVLVKQGNTYLYSTQSMDNAAYRQFLQTECPQAWQQYKQGSNCAIAGWSLLGAGLVGASLSSVFGFVSGFGMSSGPSSNGKISAIQTACICGFTLSCAMLAVSVPLLSVGYTLKDKSVTTYNQQCNRQALELSFFMSGSEACIALNF